MPYLGNTPADRFTTTTVDTFNGDNSTTEFTLSRSAVTNDLEVIVENVQQEPTTAYSVSGTTLTFTAAPPTGTGNIYVIHRGAAISSVTPADGTVSVNMLSATGTKSSSTFLAGDNSFKTVAVTPTAVSDQANSSTGFFALPSGTTAERPSSPANGYVRYNTTENYIEEYRNGIWQILSNIFTASGGTEVTSGGYKYHTFTSSDTFTVTAGSAEVEYLIIAGGGGGGQFYGAGGGAGGLLNGTYTVASGSYNIVIGAGGAAKTINQALPADNGGDSTAFGLTAIGGGGGGGNFTGSTKIGQDGGSGGGTKAAGTAGGSGTSGQGFDGGAGTDEVYCGGGGGAGGAGGTGVAGTSAGDGGLGTTAYSAWATATSTGVSGYYASGGPGGGGVNDAHGSYSPGAGIGLTHATVNTGSGGSGGGQGDYTTSGSLSSSNGGSGIVIIRYAI